jgi:hypothetical protein
MYLLIMVATLVSTTKCKPKRIWYWCSELSVTLPLQSIQPYWSGVYNMNRIHRLSAENILRTSAAFDLPRGWRRDRADRVRRIHLTPGNQQTTRIRRESPLLSRLLTAHVERVRGAPSWIPGTSAIPQGTDTGQAG